MDLLMKEVSFQQNFLIFTKNISEALDTITTLEAVEIVTIRSYGIDSEIKE